MQTVEVVAQLSAAAERFAARTDSFASGKAEILRSMAERVSQSGSFASEKQAEFARKLIEWSVPRPAPVSVAVNEGGIAKVRGLISTAKSKGLKHPKIRLQTDDGKPVVVSVAGPKSRYSGDLMLTDGGSFGSNVWYGRIAGSELVPSRAMTPQVQALLEALGNDPERVAAAYGRLTGNCCFCSKALTDGRSTAVGYGPICADKFGLAWGSKEAQH